MKQELEFERHHRLAREIVETLVLTVLMFFIIHGAVQNFTIQGYSMEPTLHNFEFVLIDKWSYVLHKPERGDVVVFDAPPQPGEFFIKRIIGVPGDIISVENGVPTVNGVRLQEFYVAPEHRGAASGDRVIQGMKVPEGNYFVMGDNRKGSYDSRAWGFVPAAKLVGKAAVVCWPLGEDNDGLLPNVSSVFTQAAHKAEVSNHVQK